MREALASDLSILADGTRLRILRLLVERPLTVAQLQQLVGVSQSSVSQHLARLRAGGWVSDTRVGQQVLYHWHPERLDRTVAGVQGVFASPLDGWQDLAERWQAVFGEAPTVSVEPYPCVEPVPAAGLPHVLFVCTGNSARSQMAEGFMRVLGRGEVPVESAGIEPAGLHPLAVRVMAEVGLDISDQSSKVLTPGHLDQAQIVVTLCGGPVGWRPDVRSRARWLHWPLPDPARAEGAPYRRLARFREVRDLVRRSVERLLGELTGPPANVPAGE